MVRCTLVADGGSDRALVPIVRWVLERVAWVAQEGHRVEFSVGDGLLSRFEGLKRKVDIAVREFPCDLLLIHRDAENERAEARFREIAEAVAECGVEHHVPVVPVRMTEAWLLIDEAALRRAADNPNGVADIRLPPLQRLDALPDPKAICNDLLIRASEKQGRRKKKFSGTGELASRRARIAQLIGDFSPLLQLPAFRQFHEDTMEGCERLAQRRGLPAE